MRRSANRPYDQDRITKVGYFLLAAMIARNDWMTLADISATQGINYPYPHHMDLLMRLEIKGFIESRHEECYDGTQNKVGPKGINYYRAIKK